MPLPHVTYDIGLLPSAVSVGDFNKDGYDDIAVTAEGDDELTILLNNQNKSFTNTHTYSTGLSETTGLAPVSLKQADFNDDGNLDLIVAGNYYEREVETIRSDASIGYVMLGDGKGAFQTIDATKAGLKLYQDVRDIKLIKTASGLKLLGAVNGDVMQFYSLK